MKGQSWRLGFQLTLFLLLLLCCWWLLRTIRLEELGRIWQQLTITKGALLVAANLLVLITLTNRWWLFLFGLGYPLPFFSLLRYRIAAFAVSYFTPGPHFGGEPLQVYLVNKRHNVPVATAIAAVTLDKVLEMAVNFTMLAGGAFFILQQQVLKVDVAHGTGTTLWGVLLLPLAGGAFFWSGRQRLFDRMNNDWRVPPRLVHWLTTLHQSLVQVFDLWQHKPQLFLAAGAVSLLSWVALIGEFWYMTAALDLGLGFAQAMTLLLAMRVAILLPMPAGLGTLEASLALATTALGLSPAAGLSMGLLIRLRDVILGLVGLWLGGFALWRQALPAQRAVLEQAEEEKEKLPGMV